MRAFAVVVVSLAVSVAAQTAGNPTAPGIAQKAIAALTGGVPVRDVTLTANVTAFAGSNTQTGTATLAANGNASRIDFNLSGGTRSEVLGSHGGAVHSAWTQGTAAATPIAGHNTWTDSAWFFPAFSSLGATGVNYTVTYIGQETRNGLQVQHLQVYQVPQLPPGLPTPSAGAPPLSVTIQHLSTIDYYLDAQSLLPLAATFNVHPDNDARTDIPAEVRFANYQRVNGVEVPFHIQRLLNNGLVLDMTVTQATINSGLGNVSFVLP